MKFIREYLQERNIIRANLSGKEYDQVINDLVEEMWNDGYDAAISFTVLKEELDKKRKE